MALTLVQGVEIDARAIARAISLYLLVNSDSQITPSGHLVDG